MPLPEMTLIQSLAIFFVAAGVVWFAGARLAYLADAMAEKFGLARSIVGLVLLAVATSLPEIATTLGAAARQSQDLVLNNLYGGIALQTAILAMSDFWARGAITNYPRKTNHALEAALLVMLLSLTLVVITLGETRAIAGVGLGSIVIAAGYCGAIWLLRRYDGESDWIPVDQPGLDPLLVHAPRRTRELTDRELIGSVLLACAAILIFGIALVAAAEQLAVQTGLGSSFIGVTLLAAATSLPELTTSIAAVRLGAYTMAISNIFGSNLIMLVLVLPADMLLRAGPVLQDPPRTAVLALAYGIFVTSVYLAGLIIRRKPKIGSVGIDSLLVLLTFAMSLWGYYALR